MARRLLVTGGDGFIGCNFVCHWMHGRLGDEIVVLDALTYVLNSASQTSMEIPPNFEFVLGDINDTVLVKNLLRAPQIDIFVRFVVDIHADRSIAGPDIFVETKIYGTHSLLKSASDHLACAHPHNRIACFPVVEGALSIRRGSWLP